MLQAHDADSQGFESFNFQSVDRYHCLLPLQATAHFVSGGSQIRALRGEAHPQDCGKSWSTTGGSE